MCVWRQEISLWNYRLLLELRLFLTARERRSGVNIVEPIKKKKDIAKFKKVLSSNKRNLLLFNLGINSGLRISDILALNVKDVKDKEFIEIHEKKTRKYKKFPINKNLQHEIAKFVVDKEMERPLFITQKGKRLDRVQAYKLLNRAAKKAKLDINIGTHTLRKTFGYHHYKKFDNLPLLQKILNHSSSAITLRYIGLEQDVIDESYNNFYL